MPQRLDYTKTSPAGVKAYAGVYAFVNQCGLENTLIELVYLRVSQLNGCAYCLDMHTRALIKHGFSPVKLALVQVWEESGEVFTEREKAALAWAEVVTHVATTHVPDDAFNAASGVFTQKELADLTMAIGLINAYNRLAISFRNVPQEASVT